MRAGAIAKRYARAAFEVAQANDATDRWLEDLRRLGVAVSDPGVARWLAGGKVTAARKEEVLASVLTEPNPLLLNFIRLLIAKDRATLLPEIAAMFERSVNEAQNVAIAEVTTAVPIDEAEASRIAGQLSAMTGRNVIVNTRVDPEIIGGVIARIGDRVLDGSVRTRLVQLRRELASGARTA